MIGRFGETAVVATAFGNYPVHPVEVDAFRQIYSREVSHNFFMPSWEEELTGYATERMRAQWLAKTRPKEASGGRSPSVGHETA